MTRDRIQQLEEENLRLKAQLHLKDEQLSLKDEQLERYNERILYLERQLFGRRSEKRLPDSISGQLSLFDPMQGKASLEEEAGLTSLVEEIKKKALLRRQKQKEKTASQKRSYKLPEHIERRETILEPEKPENSTLVKIGEDISERLMVEPSKFWVERIVRPVYKVVTKQTALSPVIIQAPLQTTILPGSMASSSLLSQIITDKFLYHIPEYRQAERLKDLGVHLTTSSINRWVHALADRLYPLYIAQMEKVLSSDYIQVDETTLAVTDRPGSARKAYLWAVRSVLFPGLFFHYDKGSRSQDVVRKLLKDYQGALQSDGYAAYSIYEDKQGVLPLGCMAHVRRKFENALQYSPQAQTGLDYIALLYMLEANLRDEEADWNQIQNERMQKAYPILQQMESWMKQAFNQTTPKSPLGKAISYAFGMWPRICRYCSDGCFQIDNNGIENAIRPIALGRKNYLFAGNDNGAENYCIFYTLLGSCLQAEVNPAQWLTATLEIIPTLQTPINWEELLPSNFTNTEKTQKGG